MTWLVNFFIYSDYAWYASYNSASLFRNFEFSLYSDKLVLRSEIFSSSIALIVYKRYSSEFLPFEELDRLIRTDSDDSLKFLAGISKSIGLRKFASDDECINSSYFVEIGIFLYAGYRSRSSVKALDYYSYKKSLLFYLRLLLLSFLINYLRYLDCIYYIF